MTLGAVLFALMYLMLAVAVLMPWARRQAALGKLARRELAQAPKIAYKCHGCGHHYAFHGPTCAVIGPEPTDWTTDGKPCAYTGRTCTCKHYVGDYPAEHIIAGFTPPELHNPPRGAPHDR
jgi:hypothetical protein